MDSANGMKTPGPERQSRCLGAAMLLLSISVGPTSIAARAIGTSLTRADMRRAVSLAHWPHSDAERARFHSRYIVQPNQSAVGAWAVDSVELVTEFRRIELMAETQARLNTLWGLGGLNDVEEDARPWRGRVSIVARLELRSSTTYVGLLPPVEVVVVGPDAPVALDVHRTPTFANCAEPTGCPLIGGVIEGIFDAAAIGQTLRHVMLIANKTVFAAVDLDFAAVE